MSFAIYAGGFVLIVAGIAWGMAAAGVETRWIAITCLVLLGLGIIKGVQRTRQKDPAA
jgi:hypothetical protein